MVDFREVGVIQEHALDKSVLERRPYLQHHLFQLAVFQHAAVTVHRAGEGGVDVDALIDHAGVHHAHLHLVEQQPAVNGLLQYLDLHGVMVADAKVAYLAGFLQVTEGAGDFLRLGQRVRAVDEQRVQMIGVQLAQAVFRTGNDVLVGRVIKTGANAALALHNHAVTQAGIGGQHLTKAHFGLVIAIKIRMVEEIYAALQRGHDE